MAPNTGCRVVCYCDDCQAFAHFLGRPGITDEWGGTDLFQMAPRNLRIEDPEQALACVRLSPKGMHRFYCSECRTPIGNAVSAGVPFIGLIHSFMDHEGDGVPRDEALGMPGYSQAKFALDGLPPERAGAPWKVIGKSVSLLGKWWLTGAGSPSPLFGRPELGPKDRSPRVPPRVLTRGEREALSGTREP